MAEDESNLPDFPDLPDLSDLPTLEEFHLPHLRVVSPSSLPEEIEEVLFLNPIHVDNLKVFPRMTSFFHHINLNVLK